MDYAIKSALIKVLLGENICKIRESMNLTQEELAKKIDVTQGFLALVEKGRRSLGIEKLMDTADALEISIDSLLSIKDISAQDDEIFLSRVDEIFSYLRLMDNDGVKRVVNMCKQMNYEKL